MKQLRVASLSYEVTYFAKEMLAKSSRFQMTPKHRPVDISLKKNKGGLMGYPYSIPQIPIPPCLLSVVGESLNNRETDSGHAEHLGSLELIIKSDP